MAGIIMTAEMITERAWACAHIHRVRNHVRCSTCFEVRAQYHRLGHGKNSFEVLAETFSLSLTHPVMFKKFGQTMKGIVCVRV